MKRLFLLLLCFSVLACSNNPPLEKSIDTVLIGGGIMSATLGTLLKELDPKMSMEVFERLDVVAAESSAAMNNAGTGHSAFCELNYTPENADGSINTKKAVGINESFEISKQFWAYQVQKKVLPDPKVFINNVPHMSFVWGEDNVKYLKKRYEALQQEPLFRGMQYSENHDEIRQWIPLVMEGRDSTQRIAATRMDIGTDVNFGSLTKAFFEHMSTYPDVKINVRHEVRDIKRNEDSTWNVIVKDLDTDSYKAYNAKFVFIGAGGGALKLLQKSGIPEAKGYGGVSVGGEWLVTTNQSLIERHQAKVYGKASVGSPPMSVPHLDTRVIDGKKALLFGPFATFSTKFLMNGSWLDLFGSLNTSNIIPMIQAGLDNIPLTRYLIEQLMLSEDERISTLREYFPNAEKADWNLEVAGQRVQIVKKSEEKGGVLEFGTEIVGSEDGSVAALLGASPGASTAAPIMITLVERSFKGRMQTPEWQAKIKEIIPSYGKKLNGDLTLLNKTREWSSKQLQLKFIKVKELPAEKRIVNN